MVQRILLSLLFCLSFAQIWAQGAGKLPQQYLTKRTNANINVDAVLDESAWAEVSPSGNFTQVEPVPGASSSQNAEVRVLYDDKAIYVAAQLYDTHPDSIFQQLSQRDQVGITDWFAFIIDAYQDGLNGLGFIVTSGGVQIDLKYSSLDDGGGVSVLRGDRNWDAVWESATRFTADGWVLEMKILYSALRFPNQEVQEWNINFARMIRRKRELSFWNEVRPDQEGLLLQSGVLKGINAIKPPLRLSATPFIAANFVSDYDRDSDPKHQFGRALNGGMDIKYGINDAFTLDMTLIPDFGQVQSDNQVLNLSPFEVRFDENRQFFTEGTELFNKGNLFYSRRVGGRPLFYDDVEDQLKEGEEISSNPTESPLYNATKVSGRMANGLGLGFFNATSRPTYAEIENTETGEKRKVQTAPLTNYNVMVADQNLRNNSYITLINTHVWRSGSAYDANVTGTEFQFNNKNNSYNLSGDAALSQQYYSQTANGEGRDSVGLGHKYSLNLSKISGNFQYGAGYNVESRHYDPNDLGFLFNANEASFTARWNYGIFKPFGRFNRANFGMFTRYSRLESPNVFTDFGLNIRSFAMTKEFFAFGLWSWLEPFNTFDYFEPRSDDFSRYYHFPKNYTIGGFVSSDYRKRFAYDVDFSYRRFDEPGRQLVNFEISPRVRVNDKLDFILEVEGSIRKKDIGYISPEETAIGYELLGEEDILFGRRDQFILDNTLNGNYIFTNRMGINLRIRHYWTRLEYIDYQLLEEDGSLSTSAYLGQDKSGQSLHNTTFNIFNIDLVYRWRFAPGSDIFIVWKNAIVRDRNVTDRPYLQDLTTVFENPQTNNLSIKLIYFLDYLALRKS
ncbi:MAG: DUF5916 domain-containing protein [Bacteroidota bacterium]